MGKQGFYDAFPRLNIIRRILEDKAAIEECHDKKQDVRKLIDERNIRLAQPI